MKKLVLVINILIMVCINGISYASQTDNQNVEINVNKSEIKFGEEIEISIDVPTMDNTIYAYSGELEYDREIFENITSENNFNTANSWQNLEYNEENGKFIITNNGSNGNEQILKIKMKCKKDKENANTKISIKNLKTVDETKNQEVITLNEKQLDIAIKNQDQDNEKTDDTNKDQNQDNGKTDDTNKDQNQDNVKEDDSDKDSNQKNDVIDDNNQGTNESNKEEQKESIFNGKLPNAGEEANIILWGILILLFFILIILKKYKKLNKKTFVIILALVITSNTYINVIQASSNNLNNGDVNIDGKVDLNDIKILEKYLIDLEKLSDDQKKNADIYEDNKIDLIDLHYLIKKINNVDNDDELPKYNFEQITPEDSKVIYEPVLMANEKMTQYGITGAGSQWPVSLESSKDGELMLYGIDVAGIFKSTDHGKTWVRANSGITSNGAGMFAIDPNNINHVATLGLSEYSTVGGIHISYDKAETWNKTFQIGIKGYRYLWDGLEFDPTSYDSAKKCSTDLYFSTPYKRDTQIRTTLTDNRPLTKLEQNEVGLYKSNDCGETFSLIINDPKVADGIIKFTNEGKLYIGNQYGLFLINTSENKIEKSYSEFENDPSIDSTKGVTGLDVVGNVIYVQTWDGIFKVENDTVTKITTDTYDARWPQFLTVSKTNPNHMVYQFRGDVNNYYTTLINVTFDGGKTWQISKANLETTFYHNVNFASREKAFIIDPSKDSNVITFGGDNIFRSSDGGLNFVQASGVSNMMQGGKFQFNYYNPDLILLSAQDYTGVISKDGGKTFTSLKMNKGNFYAGFAADENTIYGFANTSWGGGTLTYTHDGGTTWTDTGLKAKYEESSALYTSLQSITDPNVLFAQEYYSKDKGFTWQEMNGCVGVYAYNYTGKKELYGANKDGNIVVSYDNGDTWQVITKNKLNNGSVSEKIYDLAYDHVNNYIYAIVRENHGSWGIERVYKYDINTEKSTELEVPRDTKRGYMRIRTIAVDPKSTSVIYVGGSGDYFSSSTGLVRSIDGGENWRVLTTANNPDYNAWANNQGGYEVTCIAIQPLTGKVWLSSGCYGHSTINPPYKIKK